MPTLSPTIYNPFNCSSIICSSIIRLLLIPSSVILYFSSIHPSTLLPPCDLFPFLLPSSLHPQSLIPLHVILSPLILPSPSMALLRHLPRVITPWNAVEIFPQRTPSFWDFVRSLGALGNSSPSATQRRGNQTLPPRSCMSAKTSGTRGASDSGWISIQVYWCSPRR